MGKLCIGRVYIRHFNNFKVTAYCVAQILENMEIDVLKEQYEFVEKYVGIDKVYLEPYREGHWVDKAKMKGIIDFLERDVEVAGGSLQLSQILKKRIQRDREFSVPFVIQIQR